MVFPDNDALILGITGARLSDRIIVNYGEDIFTVDVHNEARLLIKMGDLSNGVGLSDGTYSRQYGTYSKLLYARPRAITFDSYSIIPDSVLFISGLRSLNRLHLPTSANDMIKYVLPKAHLLRELWMIIGEYCMVKEVYMEPILNSSTMGEGISHGCFACTPDGTVIFSCKTFTGFLRTNGYENRYEPYSYKVTRYLADSRYFCGIVIDEHNKCGYSWIFMDV
jgi:hypothetical protein